MQKLLKTLLITGGAMVAGSYAARMYLRSTRWFSYEGKSVLVVGGSRGLGLLLARELVDAGAKVAICARTEEDVRIAESELRNRGGAVTSKVCDIRDPDQVRAMVGHVVDRFGTVDVLMNVAGIIQVGPIDSMTIDDFRLAMDTHFWGMLHTTRAVLPHMRRQRWGRIVNVSSIGGKVAVPHLIPYVASKFALVGFSNALRAELAQEGILVTTVCPGLMRTGSPRNAIFKGQHRKEYAWFNLSSGLPVISMDAQKAARQILLACQRGDGEVLIRNSSNLTLYIPSLIPEWTREILAVVNYLLPSHGGIGQHAARGYESESSISPSLLTKLSDDAAPVNNELRLARQE